MEKKKGVPSHTPKSTQIDYNKLGKEDSILLHFARGNKLHRFQAELLGDHCLHTTISDLQKKYSISFDRITVKVPNNFGTFTSVKQYWLSNESLLKAQRYFGIDTMEAV